MFKEISRNAILHEEESKDIVQDQDIFEHLKLTEKGQETKQSVKSSEPSDKELHFYRESLSILNVDEGADSSTVDKICEEYIDDIRRTTRIMTQVAPRKSSKKQKKTTILEQPTETEQSYGEEEECDEEQEIEILLRFQMETDVTLARDTII
jgi:hypothetical protein